MNTCCSKSHSIQGILLSVAFVLGSKMINLNNKKNNPIVKATILAGSATIIVLVAAVGATIIEINWSADAFVIPGLGEKMAMKK
ncbi:MAG: hypothetical protein K0S84_1428 [Nitrososphaera sp.]|nr:hypothetical protein [Nitrososphaera sp.]